MRKLYIRFTHGGDSPYGKVMCKYTLCTVYAYTAYFPFLPRFVCTVYVKIT